MPFDDVLALRRLVVDGTEVVDARVPASGVAGPGFVDSAFADSAERSVEGSVDSDVEAGVRGRRDRVVVIGS